MKTMIVWACVLAATGCGTKKPEETPEAGRARYDRTLASEARSSTQWQDFTAWSMTRYESKCRLAPAEITSPEAIAVNVGYMGSAGAEEARIVFWLTGYGVMRSWGCHSNTDKENEARCSLMETFCKAR